MMMNMSVLQDLRQRMEVAISTFYKMEGRMPSFDELADVLGNEYDEVISEYTNAA